MKKNSIRLGLAFALALAFTVPATMHAANATNLNSPAWGQGKPIADTSTKLGVSVVIPYGLYDCSGGQAVTAVLATTSRLIMNVTSTAGLSPTDATTPYTGSFRVHVVNAGLATAVVWASDVTSTVAETTPAGLVLAAGTGGYLEVASKDGISVWAQGLTATTSPLHANICNY